MSRINIKKGCFGFVAALLLAFDVGAALPAFSPGTLITVEKEAKPTLSAAGHEYRMTYISTAFNGQNTVVTGLAAFPTSASGAGGYPIISWGNGTTGFAPQCAPSLDENLSRDAYLNEWRKRGYAVLRTDYGGWGAQGPRPLLDGKSNANSIADIVIAAHALPENLSADWLAVGHSEGGGAVIWNAAATERTAKRYPLKGAIAIAPVGPGISQFMEAALRGGAVRQKAQPFISVTVLGAAAVDPSVNLQHVLTSPILKQANEARRQCLSTLMAETPQLKPGEYLKAGADYEKIQRYLHERQDPSGLILKAPLLVLQGEQDETTVTPDTTQQMVRALCTHGGKAMYRQYAGETHRSVIAASQNDAFGFAEKALAGHGVQCDNGQ
ncbi:TPA: alpha/beta hydrolase family protein [Serratia marcescens]